MENEKMVYRAGDGSALCEDCLAAYLRDTDEPNTITAGQDTDADGLPVYGWSAGDCSDCRR